MSLFRIVLANVGSRAAVYGALIGLTAAFAPALLLPAAPVLALSAAEPWVGDGVGWLHDKALAKWPKVVGWIDEQLNHFTHHKSWWKNTVMFLPVLALALISHPAAIPGFVWDLAVPGVLVTAVPFATKWLTTQIEKLPFLRGPIAAGNQILAERKAARLERRARIEGPQQQVEAPAQATEAPSREVTRRVAAPVSVKSSTPPAASTPQAPAGPSPAARAASRPDRSLDL